VKNERFRNYRHTQAAEDLARYSENLNRLPVRVVHEEESTEDHPRSIYEAKYEGVTLAHRKRHQLKGVDVADHCVSSVAASVDKHQENRQVQIGAEIHSYVGKGFN